MDFTFIQNRSVYVLPSDLGSVTFVVFSIFCSRYIPFINATNWRECDLQFSFGVDVADRREFEMSLVSDIHQNHHDQVSKFTGPFERGCLLPIACCLLPVARCLQSIAVTFP